MKLTCFQIGRKFLLLAICCIFTLSAYSQSQSQSSSVNGKVIDAKTKQSFESVSISVLRITDSTFVSGTLSGKTGEFNITVPAAGNYLLKVSFVGYKSVWKPVILQTSKVFDAGTIALEEGILLNEITIAGEVIAVKVKTDTTEFNTAAFKAAPDASVEDGLKKVPGIEIDKDGKIKANGEDVQKVYVDGKEFFGNDPKIATKNLPYDAIGKVQVIQEKSEQAKASGVDDGKRTTAINLILKDDKKNGWFGSGTAAGGTKDRYLGSTSINRFTKTRQINALFLSNNMNQIGYTQEEATNFGGGGGTSSSMSSINGVVSYSVNGVNVGSSNQGLTNTNSGGLNFSDTWGKKKKLRFSGSYFGSGASTIQESQSNVESFQVAGKFYDISSTNNTSANKNHRLNIRMSGPIDSLTSFNFSPSITLGFRDYIGKRDFSKSDEARNPVNSGSGKSDNNSFSPSINGNMSISRSLKGRKGMLSLYLYGTYSGSNTDNLNISQNIFAQAGKAPILINRMENSDNGRYSLSVNPTLNRNFLKDKKVRFSLSVSPTFSVNNSNYDRVTLEYNPSNGFYELPVAALTNDSKTKNTELGLETGFSKSTTKWNFSLRSTLSKTFLEGSVRNDTYFESTSRQYLNLLPYAYITFRPTKTANVTFSSNAYVSAPSISDLLSTQNNASPLYIREGNPDLKMGKTFNNSIRYSSSNAKKNTYTNFSISYYTYLDAMASSSFLDQSTGITTSKRINVDGNHRMSMSGNFSLPSKIKNLRISPGFSLSKSRNVSMLNGVENNSDQVNGGANMTVSYSYKESFNLTLNNNTSYTHINNTVQRPGSAALNNYFNLNTGGNISFEPIKKWRLNTEVTHTSYAGQQVVLVNAGLQHYMMNSKKLSIELKGFDLLNRNSDIMRYTSENSITDMRNNSIRQYFFMRLVYKVNKIGSTPARPSTIVIR